MTEREEPRRKVPFGPPVDLPPGITHGTAKAHQRPYRCRCVECLTWRREYDNNRPRRVYGSPAQVVAREGWYVCAGPHAVTYAEHSYGSTSRCVRCGANRETEELWETRWKESRP